MPVLPHAAEAVQAILNHEKHERSRGLVHQHGGQNDPRPIVNLLLDDGGVADWPGTGMSSGRTVERTNRAAVVETTENEREVVALLIPGLAPPLVTLL